VGSWVLGSPRVPFLPGRDASYSTGSQHGQVSLCSRISRYLAHQPTFEANQRLSDACPTDAESKTSPKLEQVVKKIDDVLLDIDDNVLQYCSLDNKVRHSTAHHPFRSYLAIPNPVVEMTLNLQTCQLSSLLQGSKPKSKQSLGQKEQEFLDAMRVSTSPAGRLYLAVIGWLMLAVVFV